MTARSLANQSALVLGCLLRATQASAEPPAQATETPRAPDAVVETERAEADLARLRSLLTDLRADARAGRRVGGFVSLADGLASAGVGTYYLFDDGASYRRTRLAGSLFVLRGAIATGMGVILLTGPEVRGLASLADAMDRSRAVPATFALKEVELRWEEAAERARRERLTVGWLTAAIGVLGVGFGLALPSIAADERSDAVPALALVTVLSGSTLLSTGVERLTVRSDLERAWLAYRAMSVAARSPPRPSQGGVGLPRVGIVPLGAGGGFAAVGVDFQ